MWARGDERRIVDEEGNTLLYQRDEKDPKAVNFTKKLKRDAEIFVDEEERTVPAELQELIITLAMRGDIKKVYLSEAPNGILEIRDAEQKDFSQPPIRFTIATIRSVGEDGTETVRYEARDNLGVGIFGSH
jgi:hypothetical protein